MVAAVGGGGSGGFGSLGGGGGAGSVIYSSSGVSVNSGQTISVSVGAGAISGMSASDQSTWSNSGKSGETTSVTIGSNTFLASGGGGGGGNGRTSGLAGGSGGGSAAVGGNPAGAAFNIDYAGWVENANSGYTSTSGSGGGGGGAGAAATGINGAIGVTVFGYKVGGGGGGWQNGNANLSWEYGGGYPKDSNYVCPSNKCNGVANTGGGGGAGGNGGSGVAMIKFIPAQGQGTIAQSNGFTINRKTTFAFTRTGIAPASTTASYQWQVKASGSSTWNNVTTGTGGTTLNYQTANLTSADNANSYRIAVTDSQETYGISTTTYTEVSTQSLFVPPGSETDSALVLNGTNQFAWAADDNSLDIDNAFTFQAWVKPSSINAGVWNIVFGKYGSFQIGISTTGKWAYAIAGAVEPNGASTSVLAVTNEWHHIAFTRSANSNNLNFYYDGILISTHSGNTVPTGALTNSTDIFSIGALRASSSASEKYFAGAIDQVGIYTSARSQTSIKNDMNSYLDTSDTSLKLYYDMNEGSGSTIYNRIVGGTSTSDLTLVGSNLFNDVKVVDTTTLPAYTIVKFPRTYLTALSGWKVPANIPKVSVLAVAGGGAGGSRVGGGGGAGGYVYRGSIQLTGGSVETITIGVGGIGVANYAGNNGSSTEFGTRLIAIGGGGGGTSNSYSGNRKGRDGGSGGGGGDSTNDATRGYGSSTQTSQGSADGFGFAGGIGDGGAVDWSAGGGGGASSSGYSGASGTTKRSFGGDGRLDPIGGSNLCLAAGGGGGVYGTAAGDTRSNAGGCSTGSTTSGSGTSGLKVGLNAAANSGSGGGGAGYFYAYEGSDVAGGNGGSGVIIIRWITALVPSYTKPTTAYLNVGMTETFTTNVAVDSATVGLTRTFKWESTTPLANGAYTLIKQGTGAANAFFSWIPSDTSTSGSGYLYRLTVTDSDTAGLFITDSSTAYAVINRALSVSGTTGIAKTINVAKSETFTITLGTSTYKTTLTSNNPGISLDTSTATSPVIKISETMTVGIYYETLTVTDSVSASVVTPLTIVVSAPPSLLNTNEIVDSNLIYHLEAGNSQSLLLSDGEVATSKTWKDLSGNKKDANTSATFESGNWAKTCTAPTYYAANGGYLDFNGSTNCYYSSYIGSQLDKDVSVEVWFKLDANLGWASIVQQNYSNTTSSASLSYALGPLDTQDKVQFGIYANGYRKVANGFTPTVGVWTHVAGTYDGIYFRLYKDGNLIETSTSYTTGLGSYSNFAGTLIGKRGSSGEVLSGGIASIKIYKKALTSSQVLSNYLATRNRFLTANVDFSTSTQKYGTSTTETFTSTSGYGSDTISYSTGNNNGAVWTTTGATTTLKLQESMTATTYYDTITVTDSLGASTYLPIKMTVSKADTLTISMDTATTVVYNASPITFYPKVYFKGLAGVDTLTASTRFTSSTYIDSATVPTDVDTYTVIAANPVFSVGALSNYVNVVYETSTAKVTQANQNKLSINLYGAVAGSSFLIQTYGGSGYGPVTESVTAGSTATGCAVSNHVLSNTSPTTQQVTCNILVTKAASKNYKVETLTATVYFMLYVNNMPSNQVGSGSTIGLNGINSVWVDPGATPTITGPGAGTYAANGPIIITGSGFSLGPIIVKFERNQLGSNITVASDTSMTVTIPSGARSGVFSVTNKNGTEFSSFVITIG